VQKRTMLRPLGGKGGVVAADLCTEKGLCPVSRSRQSRWRAGWRGILAATAWTAALLGAHAASAAEMLERCPKRTVWIAPSYHYLFGDALGPRPGHGFGVSANYEFHISGRFNLGLLLAFREYPGDAALHQLGYGAILKHFFARDWVTEDGVFPFLDYGLLLQQSFVSGRKGSSVSHDTELGGGALFRISGVPLFFHGAAHLARLDAFDQDSEWVPYLDIQLGWAPSF
jgi:hypothetical protein